MKILDFRCPLTTRLSPKFNHSVSIVADDVGSLLPMLILFSYENEASSLQDSFDGLLLMIKNSMTEIWRNDSVESETRMASGPQLTVNNIVRNWQTERRMESEMNTGKPMQFV